MAVVLDGYGPEIERGCRPRYGSVGILVTATQRSIAELLRDPALSTYREQVLEQVFAAELIQSAWRIGLSPLEIDRPFVDFKGYDLVVTCEDLTRHVQLKAVFPSTKTGDVPVQEALTLKPAGCVVLMLADVGDEDRLILQYRFLGDPDGGPLSLHPALKVTRRTRPNSAGEKVERLGHRNVPYRRRPRDPEDGFGSVRTIDELCSDLFGCLGPG